MKKNLVLIAIIVIFAFTFIGCAGHISSRVERDKAGNITYTGNNANLFGPPAPGPEEVANAYMTMAMADSLKYSPSAPTTTKKYVIGVINNDPHQAAYFFHPELPGVKCVLQPNGGYEFVQVMTLPNNLVLYRADGIIASTVHPEKDFRKTPATGDAMIGGFRVDIRYTINSM